VICRIVVGCWSALGNFTPNALNAKNCIKNDLKQLLKKKQKNNATFYAANPLIRQKSSKKDIY